AKKVDISSNKPLKRDNIAPETVIEAIKEYRVNEKIKYDRYEEPEDVSDVIVY
ncbi:16492_t:CDS:1, partial [Rhizophagus irregularis]